LARESLFLLPEWEKVRDVMALATSEMWQFKLRNSKLKKKIDFRKECKTKGD